MISRAPSRSIRAGSSEALTNEAGTVVERRSYDAFGARRDPAWGAPPSASFATTSSLGFTGHEDDADLGLVNMKGRLYDPHLSRFLTPDPIVAHPAFGQSWNPYSYVLNDPLSHVDPTGFTEEPADVVVSPGGFLIIPGPSDEPYVDMVWQVFAVGAESEGATEAPDSGAAVLPQDANTWGNNAGWLPQPSATAQELPRQNSVGLDVYIGVTQGTAELALDVAKSLVLNALTFGGYGTWQLGKAVGAGYHEKDGGFIGALNAVNPLYQLARGGADTYMAADRENYRAAGAAGVKTVVLGAAAVVGIAQGVGALTGRGAAARAGTTALGDLARFRSDLGLAAGEGTLARLDISGRSFYGINAHGQKIALRTNSITATHAEADAFQQAANAGVRSSRAQLHVDRGLCRACGQFGGVRSLARELGIQELEVFTPEGSTIIHP